MILLEMMCPFNIFEICKYLRNKCNSLVRRANADYIRHNLLVDSGDPRKFWKSINNLLKGPKRDVVAHEFIDKNTGNVVPQEGLCNFLNDYYANIGKLNMLHVTRKPEWNNDKPGFFFDPVTNKETLDLIKDIDIGKDSCIDGIFTEILKESLSILNVQLQHLFNVSLVSSTFPREWAKGFINILPKGGNLKDPSNWRPITQPLLPGKLLEKIVQCRLLIMNLSNFISKKQYGFLPGDQPISLI